MTDEKKKKPAKKKASSKKTPLKRKKKATRETSATEEIKAIAHLPHEDGETSDALVMGADPGSGLLTKSEKDHGEEGELEDGLGDEMATTEGVDFSVDDLEDAEVGTEEGRKVPLQIEPPIRHIDSIRSSAPSDAHAIPVRAAREESEVVSSDDEAQPAPTDVVEEDAITSIYKANQEDLTRLTRRKKSRLGLWFIGVLLIILAGLSIAGFFLFDKTDDFSGAIDLLVSVPETAASGETIQMKITVTNNEPQPVRNAEIRMRPPRGYTFIESLPASQGGEGAVWDLGSIPAGGTRDVVISAKLQGNLEETQVFDVRLTYKPGNFNYDFEKVFTAATTITASLLDLQITAPEKAVIDDQVTYVITVTNTTEDPIERVRLRLTYPSVFGVKQTSVKPTVISPLPEWDFGTIDPGKEKTIEVSGTIGGEAGGRPELLAQIGVIPRGGDFQLQAEMSYAIEIIAPTLDVSLEIGGAGDTLVSSWGEEVSGVVRYENKGQYPIAAATIRVELPSELVDLESWKSAKKSTRENNIVTWKSGDVSELAQIESGKKGELSFTLALRSSDNLSSKTKKDYSATVQALLTGKAQGTDAEQRFVTNTLTWNIGTTVSLKSESRYFDAAGTQVGSGPLPLQVGRTTVSRVYWTLTNATSDATSLTVSTILPQDVLWQNEAFVSAGEAITFDPTTRRVTWKLNRLPAHSGTEFPALVAWFSVGVQPREADLDKFLILTEDTAMNGKDGFGARDLSVSAAAVTTRFTTDTKAKDQGRVTAAPAVVPTTDTPVIPVVE